MQSLEGPASDPLAPAPSAPLAIAVRRPQLDDPIEVPDALRDSEHGERERQAEHLLHVLRESELFSRVGWAEELEGEPAILLDVETVRAIGPDPASAFSDADLVWAWGFTLGVIPMVEVHDDGVAFRGLDPVGPTVRCHWKSRVVYGWVALALLPSASWRWSRDDPARRAQMRRCLADAF